MSLFWVWLGASAMAEVVVTSTELQRSPRFNLRAGANVSGVHKDDALPHVCGELRLFRGISIEGCGNGSGFLHTRDVPDVAHFRAKWLLGQSDLKGSLLSSYLGFGITEVQRSSDAPGFKFGDADAGQVEAAGPQLSFGLSARHWLGDYGHLVMDLTVGASRVPGAVEVMNFNSPNFVFGAATLGVGF